MREDTARTAYVKRTNGNARGAKCPIVAFSYVRMAEREAGVTLPSPRSSRGFLTIHAGRYHQTDHRREALGFILRPIRA